MRSYSIAVLLHAETIDHDDFMQLESFRRAMPFASIYLYCPELESSMRTAVQKLDITLRPDSCDNRFKLVRRMFTEVDADVFAYLGQLDVPPADVSTMIHQLVENRQDMIVAAQADAIADVAVGKYMYLCRGLYGACPSAPLSNLRIFSRRFVKSFSAFERGFPVELEWTIHALELDIPWREHPVDYPVQANNAISARQPLTRLILNLQSRPLKWFGVATAINLLVMLCYKITFCLEYFGYDMFIDMTQSAIGAGIFGIMAFISALTGLALHSISHQRREIKRLHFQQHSTL